MSSFESIDYRLRPAKQTERRMIAHALTLLLRLGNVDQYRYVGMGSISFLDFTLVHRILGISDMTSIERPDNIPRVRFNAPFKCINVVEGDSHNVLPALEFDRPTIVWLDYDGKITDAILGDISVLSKKLVPGSVLMVTLNCHVSSRTPTADELRRAAQSLERAVGRARLPNTFSPGLLAGWKYAEFLSFLCGQEIQRAVAERNALPRGQAEPEAQDDERVALKQFMNFGYSDGAFMSTLGWFVDYRAQPRQMFDRVGFDSLPFFRSKKEPFVIRPPILTPREVRHLNEQIPEVGDEARSPGLRREDVKRYLDVYRHFPTYFEVAEV